MAPVVKNPPADAGNTGDLGSIPGPGRSPGGGHGSPLQCSLLENPMDRGAWQATVHRVTKSWTLLKRLSTHLKGVNICDNNTATFSAHHPVLYTSRLSLGSATGRADTGSGVRELFCEGPDSTNLGSEASLPLAATQFCHDSVKTATEVPRGMGMMKSNKKLQSRAAGWSWPVATACQPCLRGHRGPCREQLGSVTASLSVDCGQSLATSYSSQAAV